MSRNAQYRLRHIDQEDRQEAFENDADDKNLLIGIYGWKKRFLYCCFFILFAIILLNLALTIWILAVLNFSVFGTGNVVFTSNGLQIEGTALFLKNLTTSSILGSATSELKIFSESGVSLSSGDNTLLLQDEYINVTSDQFRVRLPSQSPTSPDLLAVQGSTVQVGADVLEVRGQRGLSLSGPLNVSEVRGHASTDLNLVSMSAEMSLTGRSDLKMQSLVGGVELTAGRDLVLQSDTGSISLQSDVVKISGLLLGDGTSPQPNQGYQVCMCGSGKLFLASSSGCSSYNICN